MQPLDPLRFVLIGLAGWVNEQQREVIDYLREENTSCALNWATSACG